MSASTTALVAAGPSAPAGIERPEVVRLQIVQIGRSLHHSFIALGRLLKEARDGDYHLQWGYSRFGAWVEESGLDMSERTAYDFIKIVETAERLQIPDGDLEQVKISCLKEIAALPADTDPDKVRELINDAKTMSIKEVKTLVSGIKGFTYHTLKFDQDTEDNVYQPALERVRMEYGNTMSPAGEVADITDSRAIEMLCADKLSEPEYDDAILEAEFQDVIDTGTEAP